MISFSLPFSFLVVSSCLSEISVAFLIIFLGFLGVFFFFSFLFCEVVLESVRDNRGVAGTPDLQV